MNQNDPFKHRSQYGRGTRLSRPTFDADVDRSFRRFSTAAVILGIISSLCSVAIVAAIVWGIVKLVQHFA